MRHLPFLAVVLAALASPAFAQEAGAPAPSGPAQFEGPLEYRNCLILAKTKPDQGWEEALAWQSLGGGEAARHCGAVALIGMGKYGEAATRLETLANESVRHDSVRAEMLAQAAQAWSLLGNLDRADAALRGALTLSPGNPDIMMDRAVLMAQIGHYNDAADILTHVLRAQPNRVEALALRGSAFRFLDNIPGAEDDINSALKLDPDYSEALLERGILRRMKGDDAGAREDWLRTIDIAPESAGAETARRNLEKMDVKQK